MLRGRPAGYLLLCALAATSVRAHAQGSDRAALTGHVVDPSGAAVSGAVVHVESPALIGGPREIETDAAGAYRVTDLTPGQYRVEARAPQFKTAVREVIRLEADARLVVDMPLEVAALAELVRVTEAAPVVDVTSAEAPFRLSRALLANLPSHHVVSDILNLAPGVNVNVGLGGVQRSNPILIDGVNVSDAQQLAPWASYDYNWLEDVQVVGPGAGAQYGEFSGVLQKARLRSGGNRFSGLAEFRVTRPSWADTNTSSLSTTLQSTFADLAAHILEWWDSSLQAGGPIRRDRLWFFAGVQRSRDDVRPALYAGEHSTDTRDRRVMLKVDAAPASNLRASGHYEDDRHDVSGSDLGPLTLFEATTTDTQPDRNWHGRFTQTAGARTTIELGDTGSRGTLSFNPTPPATRAGPYPHWDNSTGLQSGSAPYYMDFGSVRHAVALTVRHTRSAVPGRAHDLTAGLEHEWTRSHSVIGFPGGRSYVDRAGQPYLLDLQDEQRLATRVRRFTAYAADRWTVGERITIEPGLRVSWNRAIASQGTVLTAHPVSPRLGVAWDLTSAHTTVVRAHYGRYHDAMLTAHADPVDATPDVPLVEYEIGAAGQLTETWRSGSASSFGIDSDVRPPFFEQWTAGVERQIAAATAATVQYVGRVYRDQQGFVDRGSIYEPVTRTDPGADGQVGTADDGGPLTVYRKTNPGAERYVFTNPPDVGRRLDALQIILRRQNARALDAQASYTWSSMRGTAVNGLRSNSGGPDLGYNGVAADPNRAINADGPMPFDFTHEVKALASWMAPRGGVRLSAVYQAHTGNAWGRTAQMSTQMVIFGVRVEPRGTRRTDALHTLDLRVEKTLRLPQGAVGSVFADVFNAGNQGIADPNSRRPLWDVSGSAFGRPLAWLPPRTLRVGARLTF